MQLNFTAGRVLHSRLPRGLSTGGRRSDITTMAQPRSSCRSAVASPSQHTPRVTTGLRLPVDDALRGRLELARQLLRRTSSLHFLGGDLRSLDLVQIGEVVNGCGVVTHLLDLDRLAMDFCACQRLTRLGKRSSQRRKCYSESDCLDERFHDYYLMRLCCAALQTGSETAVEYIPLPPRFIFRNAGAARQRRAQRLSMRKRCRRGRRRRSQTVRQ